MVCMVMRQCSRRCASSRSRKGWMALSKPCAPDVHLNGSRAPNAPYSQWSLNTFFNESQAMPLLPRAGKCFAPSLRGAHLQAANHEDALASFEWLFLRLRRPSQDGRYRYHPQRVQCQLGWAALAASWSHHNIRCSRAAPGALATEVCFCTSRMSEEGTAAH